MGSVHSLNCHQTQRPTYRRLCQLACPVLSGRGDFSTGWCPTVPVHWGGHRCSEASAGQLPVGRVLSGQLTRLGSLLCLYQVYPRVRHLRLNPGFPLIHLSGREPSAGPLVSMNPWRWVGWFPFCSWRTSWRPSLSVCPESDWGDLVNWERWACVGTLGCMQKPSVRLWVWKWTREEAAGGGEEGGTCPPSALALPIVLVRSSYCRQWERDWPCLEVGAHLIMSWKNVFRRGKLGTKASKTSLEFWQILRNYSPKCLFSLHFQLMFCVSTHPSCL